MDGVGFNGIHYYYIWKLVGGKEKSKRESNTQRGMEGGGKRGRRKGKAAKGNGGVRSSPLVAKKKAATFINVTAGTI